MITGAVTNREAVLRLVVRGETGNTEVQAVVDTGFDGYLTLPPSLIATLGLRWRMRGRALLADGSESVFDAYEAVVEWDGALRRVVVHAAEATPLVGMGHLYGYRLQMEVVEGGTLRIETLPEDSKENRPTQA